MKYVHEYEAEKMFDESLRDTYGSETTVGWTTVDTVKAIKEFDETGYNSAFADWCDSEGITTDKDEADPESEYEWTFDGISGALTCIETGDDIHMQGDEAGKFEDEWLSANGPDDENRLAAEYFFNNA
jgi:hypothetical protein